MRDTNLTDGGRIVFSFISEKDNKLSKNQKIGDATEVKENGQLDRIEEIVPAQLISVTVKDGIEIDETGKRSDGTQRKDMQDFLKKKARMDKFNKAKNKSQKNKHQEDRQI